MTTTQKDKADVPIWPDVPLDMQPGTLNLFAKVLDVDGSAGQAAYRAAREALADACRVYKKINDAEAAMPAKQGTVKRVVSWQDEVDGQKLRKSKEVDVPAVVTPDFIDGVERLQKRSLPEFMRRYEHCAKVYEQLQKRVGEAVTDDQRNTPSGIAHEQAILAHAKALTKEDREAFLNTAITDEDRVTISAVLFHRPFLSGLTKEQHAAFKERAEVVLSEDKAALSAMEKMLSHMRRAGELLKERHDRVVSRKTEKAVQDRMKSYLAIKALREE